MSAPDIREAIAAHLLADAAVQAAVADRVVFVKRPQEADLPLIEYMVVSDVRGRTLDGSDGTRTARVQFDCWGEEMADCVASARALEGALDGRRGDMGGLTVLWCHQAGARDEAEPSQDWSDLGVERIPVDYQIHYREGGA